MLFTEQTYDVTSCIKVSSLPPKSNKEIITDFFENSKRSGGGDVEIVAYDETKNTAIITFQDPAGYFQFLYLTMINASPQSHSICSIHVILL